MRKHLLVGALCALGAAMALALHGTSMSAAEQVCDFLTSGGSIITSASGTHPDAKATLAVAGGCKDGLTTWGHLQYQDDGNGLTASGTSITAYMFEGTTGVDSQGQPIGTRIICGTASTNLYGNVNFMVTSKDAGEPGTFDQFDIRLTQGTMIVYTTEAGTPSRQLGGGQGGGGNIQLHKPRSGSFGGSCPAMGRQNFTLTVTMISVNSGTGTVTSVPIGINCPSDCSESYPAGTSVTLTAQADSGSSAQFSFGDCDSETFGVPPTCTVTMNTDRSVTVTFRGPE